MLHSFLFLMLWLCLCKMLQFQNKCFCARFTPISPHTYIGPQVTALHWFSTNYISDVCNLYISSFFCMFQEDWDFSFIDNWIAMRFSYDGNYDKAVESRLIVSLEEISLILRRRHSLRRAAKFRPMLGAYGLWEGRDLHRITLVIRGLGLLSHPKDHRLEQTVDTVDVF